MNPPIHGAGNADSVSANIPMRMDTRPKTLVSLLLQLAAVNNTDLGPWPPFLQTILAMSPEEINVPVGATPGGNESSCPANGAFDLQGAMLQALKSLQVRIPAVTDTQIGDYNVTLNFTQYNVPVVSDTTALHLLGPAGAPLIQRIVNESVLTFSQGNITRVTSDGFDVALAGALQTNAPTNAMIEFPQPIEIRWQGTLIASITLPPICTIPGQGVPDYRTAGHVTITNQDGFTRFATYILHNPDFTWDISSNVVNVLALGLTYSNVTLAKSISFKAFNGLPGVLANNFNIPREGPDYLNVSTDSYIPSPATLGIEMNTARFQLFFQGTHAGSLQANDLTLAPTATTKTVLTGSLMRQTNQTDLHNIGVMFSQFLQGQNTSLTVVGDEIVTPYQNGSVSWLTAAFKTLQISAILEGKIYQIIFSIQLMDLALQLTDQDPSAVEWNIPVSNNVTLATYANPFHFTLGPTSAAVSTTIIYDGVNTAQLNLPLLPADADPSTGPETHSDLKLSFQDQRLQSLDNDHFAQFLAVTTDTQIANFQLVGTTNVQANTHIGPIEIDRIPINVSSNLPGINSFGHTTQLQNIRVDHSTENYIALPLNTVLANPSNITLHTRDLYLPVFYRNVPVGRAYVPAMNLFPGDNTEPAEFRYAPQDPSDPVGQEFVSRYISPDNNGTGGSADPITTAIVVGGQPKEDSYPESPYDSLLPGLYGVTMNANAVGLGARLVLELDLIIPALSALFDSKGTAILTVHNPLKPAMIVQHISSDVWAAGSENGDSDIRATVDSQIEPTVTVPGMGTNTVNVTFVMTRGVLGSLDLLTRPLSISAILEATLEGGYHIPSLPYTEYDIYSTYDVTILGISLNVTSVANLLESMLSALSPEQVTNDLVPTLQRLPPEQVEQMSQSLTNGNPLGSLVCNAIPALKGLPFCMG